MLKTLTTRMGDRLRPFLDRNEAVLDRLETEAGIPKNYFCLWAGWESGLVAKSTSSYNEATKDATKRSVMEYGLLRISEHEMRRTDNPIALDLATTLGVLPQVKACVADPSTLLELPEDEHILVSGVWQANHLEWVRKRLAPLLPDTVAAWQFHAPRSRIERVLGKTSHGFGEGITPIALEGWVRSTPQGQPLTPAGLLAAYRNAASRMTLDWNEGRGETRIQFACFISGELSAAEGRADFWQSDLHEGFTVQKMQEMALKMGPQLVRAVKR